MSISEAIEDFAPPVVGIALAALIAWGLVVMVKKMIAMDEADHRAWQAFATEHHCTVIGRKDSVTSSGLAIGNTVDGKGNVGMAVMPVSSTTPAQVEFKCDDGVTYWKGESYDSLRR